MNYIQVHKNIEVIYNYPNIVKYPLEIVKKLGDVAKHGNKELIGC